MNAVVIKKDRDRLYVHYYGDNFGFVSNNYEWDCWYHSDDRFKTEYPSARRAINALIDSVLQKFEKPELA